MITAFVALEGSAAAAGQRLLSEANGGTFSASSTGSLGDA